jgi:hypothetical protein
MWPNSLPLGLAEAYHISCWPLQVIFLKWFMAAWCGNGVRTRR